jgi:hypothetical protein
LHLPVIVIHLEFLKKKKAMENNRLQEGRMQEEKRWVANTEERFYQLREVKRKAEKTAAEGARTCVLPKEGCNV